MSVDFLIILIAVTSFALLLVAQIALFRFVAVDQDLNVLKVLCILMMGTPSLITGVFFYTKALDVSTSLAIMMALLSQLIYLLLIFIYITSVFGAYTASIRMRLLQVIAPHALSREGVLHEYNSRDITKLRLDRLMSVGLVEEKEGRYRLVKGKMGGYFIEGIMKIMIARSFG